MKDQNEKKKFDLEERLACFAEKVIDLMNKLPKNGINMRMVSQVVGSAGSSGANYSEANEAESKKDFVHKIGIVKKELRESKHWIRLLARANPEFSNDFRELWKEAYELLLIFSKIVRSCKEKKDKFDH
jgi:four helix bundle protein